MSRVHAAVLGLFVVCTARDARAGETTMAEPVIEENVTDIDGRDFPTIEFDLTPGYVRAQHSAAGLWKTGLETEWRPFDRAGVGGELDMAGAVDGAKPVGALQVVPRGALSYVVLRNFERALFLQVELGGRYNGASPLVLTDPTEFALPYWLGFRGATHIGVLDFRMGMLAEAGGSYAHAPVRASEAALYEIIGDATRGAIGVELLADWARRAPFVVAPEAQFVARVLGKPMRFEVAAPITAGANGMEATYGLSFRFVLEPDE